MTHNIAHRGASTYEPENTLRAFDRAIQMGATMLELDVHLCKDEHLIVIHDDDVSRTTNGKGHVSDMNLEQIKKFDAGKGERVPTLPEVIDLVRNRAKLYIELKGQRTPAQVVEVLSAMNFEDQVIVNSFYPWLIQKVKFLDATIETALLIGSENRQSNFLEWAVAVEAQYVHLCWENVVPAPHVLITPELVTSIHDHGLGIISWHEERLSELKELVKLKLDGICTNSPDILDTILREQEQTD